jgi:hypothetical protein
VGRVVSPTNAEPVDWFRIESRSQNISSSFPSHPSLGLSGGLTIDPQDSASGGSGVGSLSSDDGISQPEISASSNSSQGGHMAVRHEVAFIDASISDLAVFLAEIRSEVEAIVIDAAVPAPNAERTDWLRRRSQHREFFPFSVSSRGALSPPFPLPQF